MNSDIKEKLEKVETKEELSELFEKNAQHLSDEDLEKISGGNNDLPILCPFRRYCTNKLCCIKLGLDTTICKAKAKSTMEKTNGSPQYPSIHTF